MTTPETKANLAPIDRLYELDDRILKVVYNFELDEVRVWLGDTCVQVDAALFRGPSIAWSEALRREIDFAIKCWAVHP